MEDRELLELAAEAHGGSIENNGRFFTIMNQCTGEMDVWSPFTDDGDALRLAVRLNLINDLQTTIERFVDEDEFNADIYAAARRAIVCAAAEIGKQPNA